MKYFLPLFCSCFFFSSISFALGGRQEYVFENVKAIYNGEGTLTGTRVADYVYRIDITGNFSPSEFPEEVRNTLTIRPINNKEGEVTIDSINSDGPLRRMRIVLPPGRHRASSVRNINVDGFVQQLIIRGADLGDSNARDGNVYINGFVNRIFVRGQRFSPRGSDERQWWGGNIWADIHVEEHLNRLICRGGHLYYDPDGGVYGSLVFHGDMQSLTVIGQRMQTRRGDRQSRRVFGGGINARIHAPESRIRVIRAVGGTLYASDIRCARLNRLDVRSPNPGQPEPFIPPDQRGIRHSYIEVADPLADYRDSQLGLVRVRQGNVRDTIISVKGNVRRFLVRGDSDAGFGSVSNILVRSGYEGTLQDTVGPLISPAKANVSTIVNGTAIVPFRVNSLKDSDTLTVWLQDRGPALGAYISNYVGEVFSGTNRWKITDHPASGMFVWVTTGIQPKTYSNILLRVRDASIPNLTTDMPIHVSVFSSNIAPTVTYTPTNNPRHYMIGDPEPLSWIVQGYDPDPLDPLTLSIPYNPLGLQWYTTNTARDFYVYATDISHGIYSNILFTITDAGGLYSSATVDVHVVDATPQLAVRTSLASNVFSFLAHQTLSFHIIAQADTHADMTFLTPSAPDLPPDAQYFRHLFTDTIVASNLFTWHPESADAGTYTWTFPVSATTPTGGSTSSVQVTVTIVRPEPLVTTTLAGNSFSVTAGSPLEFGVVAHDNEPNDLTFFRPDTLPAAVEYIPTVFSDVSVATNLLTWVPAIHDTGAYSWTFAVMDSTLLTGKVTVVGTVEADEDSSVHYLHSPHWPGWLLLHDGAASYPGNINNIVIDGNAYDSYFISGVRDEPPEDWARALYRGRIRFIRLRENAEGNVFVTGHPLRTRGPLPPFFTTYNDVWVNGVRMLQD